MAISVTRGEPLAISSSLASCRPKVHATMMIRRRVWMIRHVWILRCVSLGAVALSACVADADPLAAPPAGSSGAGSTAVAEVRSTRSTSGSDNRAVPRSSARSSGDEVASAVDRLAGSEAFSGARQRRNRSVRRGANRPRTHSLDILVRLMLASELQQRLGHLSEELATIRGYL